MPPLQVQDITPEFAEVSEPNGLPHHPANHPVHGSDHHVAQMQLGKHFGNLPGLVFIQRQHLTGSHITKPASTRTMIS